MRPTSRLMGRSQVVRQRILITPFGGSSPPAPARTQRAELPTETALFSLPASSACRGTRAGPRLLLEERLPDIRISRALSHQVSIVGFVPEQDFRCLIVEDELTSVGAHGEHRM